MHGSAFARDADGSMAGITEREIEMNRTGGVGIIGAIVIVVVILVLVGAIKVQRGEGQAEVQGDDPAAS